jgi:hypothetical protein
MKQRTKNAIHFSILLLAIGSLLTFVAGMYSPLLGIGGVCVLLLSAYMFYSAGKYEAGGKAALGYGPSDPFPSFRSGRGTKRAK